MRALVISLDGMIQSCEAALTAERLLTDQSDIEFPAHPC
jgi:hypothetical protein